MNQWRREAEVDIIIRASNHFDLTFSCIESIESMTDMERVSLLYIDNGSEPAALEGFMTWYGKLKHTMIRLPFNHGSCRAINIGLSLTALNEAPFVLLLDNDTRIPEGDSGWLDRWLAYFEDEEAAAVGAVSDYSSGLQTPHSAPQIYTKSWQDNGNAGLDSPPDVPILASFGLMLRKSAIAEVGLLDERYEPGQFEDWDYILTLRQAGWKAIVGSSIWVHHKGSQTFGAQLTELMTVNQAKLIDKWGIEELKRLGLEISHE